LNYGKKTTVVVCCTETDRKTEAELINTEKTKITVILPGFIKMDLFKASKPNLYVTNSCGLEFTCDTSTKKIS
jgi:hypothetical protein